MNQFYNQGYGQPTLSSPSSHFGEFLKKPVIFTIAIFSFVNLLLSIISSVFSSLSTGTTQYLATFTTNGTVSDSGSLVLSAIFCIFALLPCIAFMMMYFMARSNKNPRSAVTILQVTSIIYLVLFSILTFVFSICTVTILCLGSYFRDSLASSFRHSLGSSIPADLALILMYVIFIIAEIIFILALFYQINAVRLAFSAKKILNDRDIRINGAGFIGVMNILGAVFIGFLIITSLFSLIMVCIESSSYVSLPGIGYVTKSQAILNTAFSFLTTITIFVLTIAKAKAAFGAKRHMSTFSGHIIPPQSPTAYYNDGYSNYDSNTNFNPYQNNSQNGYGNGYNNNGYNPGNTDYNNGYNNDYNNNNYNNGGYNNYPNDYNGGNY